MRTNLLASVFYNLYIDSPVIQKRSRLARRIIKKLWRNSLNWFSGETVTTKIHEEKVVVNYGYTYPIICREFKTYNDPLVEAVHQTFLQIGKPINLIDIGSAIGDTVLLLEKSLPRSVNQYICIEGDPEFYQYLSHNLAFMVNKRIINAFLSSSAGFAKSLVKIHPGTASAQGDEVIETTPLDKVIADNNISPVNFIKIDVDGFDGLVISGSKDTLRKYCPTLIFEWHPTLCLDTGNNYIDHFSALEECQYDRFVFFTNYGLYSHRMLGFNRVEIESLANALLNQTHPHAVYFDVVALHKTSTIDVDELATLNYSHIYKHPK